MAWLSANVFQSFLGDFYHGLSRIFPTSVRSMWHIAISHGLDQMEGLQLIGYVFFL